MLLAWLISKLDANRRRRVTTKECARLTERDLTDIGLSRVEIETIAVSRGERSRRPF
jgi:uncharacterized protein YjiS (DUF1127 family)